MTFPANNPGAVALLTGDEVTALHGATKTAVDLATAKMEAVRLLLVQIGGYEDGVEGFVDGLEALLTTLNGKIDTLNAAVASTAPADVTIGGLDAPGTLALFTAMRDSLVASYNLNTAGYSLTGGTYAAPTGVTIAAGQPGPTTVTLPRSGYYALDASFTGASPSLKVQILGVDGTWLDVVTRTVSGAASDPIQFPAGAQIRLFNASAGSLTAVKGRVS